MTDLEFKPVIILGAGRSGTNMLRDALTALPNIDTWPCDEIQPIWRHGNLGHPTDQFTADMATPDVVAFVRRAFVRQWKARGRPRFLIEKTCANTLRVPFLANIFPEAHYVTIVRHGEDVVSSAIARWEGKLEVPPVSYFAAKARFIPLVDLPVYAGRFVSNRIDKLRGVSQRLRTWGPIWDGLDAVQNAPLDEICARQWAACVRHTRQDLDTLALPQTLVHYENYLADPEGETLRILGDIGYDEDQADLPKAVAAVRRKPASFAPRGKLREDLKPILDAECRAYGYGV